MAIGSSGRVVVDIDPELKRRLHSALLQDGTTLKDWFLSQCDQYLDERSQPKLFEITDSTSPKREGNS